MSMILERDIGLEISRATLDGWVLKVGELLIPMVAAMRRELISGTYIQADETPVDVQTREGRGKNHQAYLWQYSRPGGTVVFDSLAEHLSSWGGRPLLCVFDRPKTIALKWHKNGEVTEWNPFRLRHTASDYHSLV
jgi:transposase IS66 family protein